MDFGFMTLFDYAWGTITIAASVAEIKDPARL